MGCSIQKPLNYIERKILTWNSQGEWESFRPKNAWFRVSELDIKTMNSTWLQHFFYLLQMLIFDQYIFNMHVYIIYLQSSHQPEKVAPYALNDKLKTSGKFKYYLINIIHLLRDLVKKKNLLKQKIPLPSELYSLYDLCIWNGMK